MKKSIIIFEETAAIAIIILYGLGRPNISVGDQILQAVAEIFCLPLTKYYGFPKIFGTEGPNINFVTCHLQSCWSYVKNWKERGNYIQPVSSSHIPTHKNLCVIDSCAISNSIVIILVSM